MKTHCDEYESTVSDPEAITLLLGALDYKKIAIVDKVREEWATGDGQVAVAFDEVADLGTFIEFEFKGEADSIEAATAHLDAFITTLDADLGDRVHAGYPHLVLGLQAAPEHTNTPQSLLAERPSLSIVSDGRSAHTHEG
ncbi:CYTH domain-containing protein [Streptomyces uncialis]|uniref:CYTH domain-containing protein n=1 Tax=Streptomyces uncialis TaxID=1048205 RepID=UPI00382F9CDD